MITTHTHDQDHDCNPIHDKTLSQDSIPGHDPHQAPFQPRLTRLRQHVLDIVARAPRPVSAYEILDQQRPHDPSATAAGVYRSLDFLTRHGLVHRLDTTKTFVACCLPGRPHTSQFLVCRQCGHAIEIEDQALNAATSALGHKLGFDLSNSTLEISGLCGECARLP